MFIFPPKRLAVSGEMFNFARESTMFFRLNQKTMTDYTTPETMIFEGEDFVQACLDDFDAQIAEIEKEYATPSKSA